MLNRGLKSSVFDQNAEIKSAGRKRRETSRTPEPAAPRAAAYIIILVQCTRTYLAQL